MVNYCVCGGCTNTSQSGHRVHHFPSRKSKCFRAWIRFVQVKRGDFTASSVTANSVICGAHFTSECYESGDLMELNMGFRCKDRVRLTKDAVPTVHADSTRREQKAGASGQGSDGASAGGFATGRQALHCKRELNRTFTGAAPQAENSVDPEPNPFPSTCGTGSQSDMTPVRSCKSTGRNNSSPSSYSSTLPPGPEHKPLGCFPVPVRKVSTDVSLKATEGRRTCVHCKRKTIFMCRSCGVPLCIIVDRMCFTEWHDLKANASLDFGRPGFALSDHGTQNGKAKVESNEKKTRRKMTKALQNPKKGRHGLLQTSPGRDGNDGKTTKGKRMAKRKRGRPPKQPPRQDEAASSGTFHPTRVTIDQVLQLKIEPKEEPVEQIIAVEVKVEEAEAEMPMSHWEVQTDSLDEPSARLIKQEDGETKRESCDRPVTRTTC